MTKEEGIQERGIISHTHKAIKGQDDNTIMIEVIEPLNIIFVEKFLGL
jgi:hypothetical protein